MDLAVEPRECCSEVRFCSSINDAPRLRERCADPTDYHRTPHSLSRAVPYENRRITTLGDHQRGLSVSLVGDLQAQRLNTPSITDGILDLALPVFGCLRVWENPHRTNSQQGKVVVGTSGRHTIDLLTYALAELSHNHLSLAPSPSPLSSSH